MLLVLKHILIAFIICIMSFNAKAVYRDTYFYNYPSVENMDKAVKEAEKVPAEVSNGMIPVCTGHATNTNTWTVDCVKLFSDIKVQHANGVELAKQYIKTKIYPKVNVMDVKMDIYCAPTIRKDDNNGKSYLQCGFSQDGKRHFYEFEFKTLDCNSDKRIEEDIFKSVCSIVGNNINQQYQYISNLQACAGVEGYNCTTLNNLLFSFNFSAEATNYGCKLKNTKVTEKLIRNSISDSIKNETVFRGFQMKFIPEIKHLIGYYIRNKLTQDEYDMFGAKDFNDLQFDCVNAVKHIDQKDTWLGIPVNGTTDDVLGCHITNRNEQKNNPKCVNQPELCWEWVDFVFDDLSENWKSYDKEGYSGLTCYSMNGIFNDAKCHGLGKKECQAVSVALEKQGYGSNRAIYDEETGLCKLRDAETAQSIKTGLKIATSVGTIALVAVTTVGTGGIVLAGAAVGTVAVVVSEGVDWYRSINANDIIEKTGKCKQEQDKSLKHDCAKQIIEVIIGKDFEEWNLNNTQMSAITESLPTLIDQLDPEKFSEINSDCEANDSWCINHYIEKEKGSDDWTVMVQDGADIVSFLAIAVVGSAQAVKAVGKGSKMIKAINTAQKRNSVITATQRFGKHVVNGLKRLKHNTVKKVTKEIGGVKTAGDKIKKGLGVGVKGFNKVNDFYTLGNSEFNIADGPVQEKSVNVPYRNDVIDDEMIYDAIYNR